MADPRKASSSTFGRGKHNGSNVGDFKVGSEIGKGSFAQVYMGVHKVSGAAVAIKSVDLEKLNKKLKENLYGEIQILKTLRHPHIVALHDCVESVSHINLIMEYCELGDLSLFIKKREKLQTHPATYDMARKYPSDPNAGLNEVVIRHFLKQLASALKFLREKNYVHRDVKPQNLLLLPSPEFRKVKTSARILEASQDSLIPATGLLSLPMLKLADFGFARVLPSTSLADTLCGSPLYMAPEILRYEKYDAKADLWSVGTVAYEMATGRPPFRARNHVELLRKIEAAEDAIRFPREALISPELKLLIRQLLKRNPVERLSFEKFFDQPVITDQIPGLVEDDIPLTASGGSKVSPVSAVAEEGEGSVPQLSSRPLSDAGSIRETRGQPASPTENAPRSPQATSPPGRYRPSHLSQSPRLDSAAGLGIRPQPYHTVSAPTTRLHKTPELPASRLHRDTPSSPPSSLLNEKARRTLPQPASGLTEEQEKAAQDVAFERDYVVVEKKQVEVNAFADEMAANHRLAGLQAASPKAMVRRATHQGAPTSTPSAISSPPLRTAQVSQGKRPEHERRGSYDKAIMGGSPVHSSSAISKAIADASIRLFGLKVPPPRLGKGHSPPLYSPYPAYPVSSGPAALIGDGRQGLSLEGDARVAQTIEDYANRSECVFGFAEVKFKQLFPIAPSMDYALGGVASDEIASKEDGLTLDAVVTLSEEALVLYVKVLTLLARAMEIAGAWWTRKHRGESCASAPQTGRESTPSQIARVNSAVQWVRHRFNETLEKTEAVRLKLVEAQKLLPGDHPSHPNNHGDDSISSAGSGVKQVFLTPGISAEKLMYDRALDMSRTAAIDEIANEHLPDCEAYYTTAIRMLEAVLEVDDDTQKARSAGSSKDVKEESRDDISSDLDTDDRKVVLRMITMITNRLSVVRRKRQLIAEAEKAHHAQQNAARRLSGDVTPRSVRSHTSS